ncbi:MAG: hypothetical protein JWR26_4703 [Pedosphaera sp.]|nr:hypothetical protein [Pedosphaera sp.]
MRLRLAILLSFTCLFARAAEIPESIFPAGAGVNIHFTKGREKDLDLIAAAGFKWVRMDFIWESIEHKKGEYDWSAYDELTANLEKRKLRALYILDYSNPLYEARVASRDGVTQAEEQGMGSPAHPESIAAFSRWAAAAATHFHGKHIIWEIWNEPNGFFWKPKPSAREYSALALAACAAIRNAEPKATIVGPASSGFEWRFLDRFLKSGVLKYLDAVTVHPYREPKDGPETAAGDYEKLRALIEQSAADDRQKNLPIISGEWGYSSKTGGVTPELQAAYLARQQLFNAFKGIPLSIWYDWKNDGTNAAEHEQNFGTVTDDLKPKPAYEAIRTLTKELAGFRILRRIETDEKDFVLLCIDNSGGCKLAAWTVTDPHSITIGMPIRSPRWIGGMDGVGHPYRPKVDNGQLVIDLDPLPKYVTVK